jgi:hypothetical protein
MQSFLLLLLLLLGLMPIEGLSPGAQPQRPLLLQQLGPVH